jgi:hypothetical protein
MATVTLIPGDGIGLEHRCIHVEKLTVFDGMVGYTKAQGGV